MIGLRRTAAWLGMAVMLVFCGGIESSAAEFLQSYGGSGMDTALSATPTADGGSALAGYSGSFGVGNDDLWVAKLSRSGAIQWQYRYGGSGNEAANWIEQTADGGYILAGYTDSFGAGSYDIWVLKLDSTGAISWSKTIGGSLSDYAYVVKQIPAGGYAVGGGTNSYGNGQEDAYFARLDANGAMIWQKSFGGTGTDEVWDFLCTADGGFLLCGEFSGTTTLFDLWLAKLDSAGGLTWEKTYGGSQQEFGFGLCEKPDGGYIAVGSTSSFGSGAGISYDGWVLSVTTTGVVNWEYTYGEPGEDELQGVIASAGGGFTVVGYNESAVPGARRGWVLQLSSAGTPTWQRLYGLGTSVSEFWDVRVSGTGLIASGDTDGAGAGAYDAWLLKADSLGSVGSPGPPADCAWITDSSVTPATTTATVLTPTAIATPAFAATPSSAARNATTATLNRQCYKCLPVTCDLLTVDTERVCNGTPQEFTLFYTDGEPDFTVSWTVDSAPAGTGNPKSLTLSPGTHSVAASLTDSCYYPGSQSCSVAAISATSVPLPTATVSGTASICYGGSTTIQAALTGTGPWNVTWSDSVTQSNVVASPATRSVNPTSTRTYTVTSVTDLGTTPNCSNTGTGSAVVTVIPLPTATVSGTATICRNSSTTIQAVLTGTGPWNVTWSDSVTQTGVATSPATRSVSPTSTTTYTVTSVTATGTTPACSSTGTGSAVVTVIQLPTATVSGTASICYGTSTTIQAVLTGTGPWNVTWSDGVTQTGVVASPATRSVSPTSTTTYTVTNVTATGTTPACSNTGTGSAVVTVIPLPTATVSGTQNICPAGSATIQAALTGSGPWNVTWSDSVTQTGVATSPATRSVSPASTTTYTVTSVTGTGTTPACSNTGTGSAVVTVLVKPTATVSGTATICRNSFTTISAALTGSGPWNVTWSDSVTQNGVVTSPATRSVSPASTTTYTVTNVTGTGTTPACSNTGTGSAVVTILPLPTATVSGSGGICNGQSKTIQAALTGTGPWNVTWSDSVTQTNVAASPATRSVSPSSTTTYTVTNVTDLGTTPNCSNTGSDSAVVTVFPTPTATVSGTASICAGGSTVIQAALTGTGPWDVLWSDGVSQNTIWTSPATRTVSPASTTTYTVTTVTDNSTAYHCNNTGTGSAVVTVIAKPTATVSGTANMCYGGSTTIQAALTGSGPWNVTWSDSVTQTGVAVSPATRSVSPTSTTTYTVTSVVGTGSTPNCSNTGTGSAVVTVLTLPTATVSGSATVCLGASTTIQAALTGSGPWNVTWSDSVTQTGVVSSPATRSVSPATTTTYTVTSVTGTGTTPNCSNTGTGSAVVTVLPLPTATVSGSANICLGGSTTIQAALTGTGPWNVTWSDSVTQSGVVSSPATRSVSPASTTTYTVTSVTDTGTTPNCSNAGTGSAVVTVYALPTATVSGSASICAGGSTTIQAALTGSGPWNVTWSDSVTQTGVVTSPATRSVSPASTTTYTVTSVTGTGTTPACSNTGTGSAVVTIVSKPTATVSGNNGVCAGNSVTIQAALTGTGPWNVTWSDSVTQSGVTTSPATRSVSPLVKTTYTVTTVVDLGTTPNCSNTGTGSATITVFAKPTATVSGNATSCAGSPNTIQAALTGTGPWDVVWSDGFSQNTVWTSPATRSVSPLTTTTYTVTNVVDNSTVFRCNNVGTGSATITVIPLPTATVAGSATICSGSSTTIMATLTGTGPWNLTWSDGATQNGVATSPAIRSVSPGTTRTYTVTNVTDTGTTPQCSNTGTGGAVVTVISKPTAAVSGGTDICFGASAILTVSASWPAPATGVQVTWNDAYVQSSSTTPFYRIVSPATTTTYSITTVATIGMSPTCTNSGTGSAQVRVNSNPTPDITAIPASASSCGGSVSLYAPLGYTTYQWYLGGNPISGATSYYYAATLSGIYTVSVEDSNGCGGTSDNKSVSTQVCEISSPGSGYPLRVFKSPSGQIRVEKVAWATAYNIYADTVGQWYSPTSGEGSVCKIKSWTDNGDGTITLAWTLPSGNRWVVVTASDLYGEGPAGNNTAGQERTTVGTWTRCGAGN